MNIFNIFRKRIKEKNKYKEMEILFDEIAALFPNGYTALTIHKIDLKELNKRIWKTGTDNTAERINRKNNTFDIILFGKKDLI